MGAQTLHDSRLYLDTNDLQSHIDLPTEPPLDSIVTVQLAGEYLFARVDLLTTLARSLDDLL